MKKNLFTLALLFAAFLLHAQDTTGLIAHWDMNGTTNDVTGHGHNGTGNNLTPAVGQDGVMGHAWYFNGVNSSITIPYSPALNVTGYTIAATVLVDGFNENPCHENIIFTRGTTLISSGIYFLQFHDFPSGGSCGAPPDTASETFVSVACSATTSLGGSDWSVYNYTPHVSESKWYNIVATFNDTVFKLYVNNVLKSTVYSPTPGTPMGVSTDSASIGYDTYQAPDGYPFAFNGIIDDVKLYGRALTDSEVVQLGNTDTCGQITQQPGAINTGYDGGVVLYTVGTSIAGATYQWQSDTGSGFANLSNGGAYSGVTTATLTVTGTTASADYLYRCLVANSSGCSDTSLSASLNLGVNNITTTNFISLYPNPATTAITIQSSTIPVSEILITNVVGQAVYSKQFAVSSLKVVTDVSAFPAGVYFVKVNGNTVRKFVKE